MRLFSILMAATLVIIGSYASIAAESGDVVDGWEDSTVPDIVVELPEEKLSEEQEELFEQTIKLAENTQDFNWDNLLIHTLAIDPEIDFKKYAPSYMKIYHPEEWSYYHQDEFERGRQLEKHSETLKTMAEEWNTDNTYGFFSAFTFGKYNFEQEKFQFKPFKKTTFIGKERYPSYKFPKVIKVFFKNHDAIDGIEMDEKAAQLFIAARRSKSGMINRNIWGYLTFEVEKIQGDYMTLPDTKLQARITSLTLFNDQNQDEIIAFYTFE